MTRVCCYVLAVVMTVPIAVGQDNSEAEASMPNAASIEIVGVALRLGMDRGSLLPRLQTFCKVLGAESDLWLLVDKEDSHMLLGNLRFSFGKLTYASRRWAQGDEDSFTFAHALRDVVVAMENEGRRKCVVDARSNRGPNSEWSYLDFYCGAKKIEVAMADISRGSGKGRYVSIDEAIGSEETK